MPHLFKNMSVSTKKTISISPDVVIEGDIVPEMQPIDRDIKLNVKGMIQKDVQIRCRSLTATKVSGKIEVNGNFKF